jgi:hypothetical protein
MFNGSWLLPAAKEAYSHRKEIAGTWQKITDWVFGQKRNVAFTGCAGVGKTVLLDHLSGIAFRLGYKPPEESQSEETARVSEVGKRIRLVTVPGQDSGPRYEALNRLLIEEYPLDGVIHVVANGFRTIRNETAKKVLLEERQIETIDDYLREQELVELDDLRRTCQFIRQSHQRHHRPAWLIVAVAKADLYYDQLDAARIKYSPLGKSDFTRILNDLRDTIGRDFFRWEAAPVCAWLESFTWNNQTVKSELQIDARDHYLATFATKLSAFL